MCSSVHSGERRPANMKIGVYTPEYPSITSVGGVGTYTRNLGRALASLGHCVHVLTPGTPQRVCNDGPVSVHVAAADHFPIIERFFPGSGSFYRIGKAMQRLAVQQQLDVVEFANWEGMGVWFSMRRSIPMVVRLHTSSLEAHSLRGRAFSRPVKWDVRRERWQALRADALVTHSEAHRREMANELGIDKDRIALVPHGVPVYPDFQRVEAPRKSSASFPWGGWRSARVRWTSCTRSHKSFRQYQRRVLPSLERTGQIARTTARTLNTCEMSSRRRFDLGSTCSVRFPMTQSIAACRTPTFS